MESRTGQLLDALFSYFESGKDIFYKGRIRKKDPYLVGALEAEYSWPVAVARSVGRNLGSFKKGKERTQRYNRVNYNLMKAYRSARAPSDGNYILGVVVELNTPLFRDLASMVRYQRTARGQPSLPVDDLMQEGIMHFLKYLAKKFDPERGIPLGSYMAKCIPRRLRHINARDSRTVHVPESADWKRPAMAEVSIHTPVHPGNGRALIECIGKDGMLDALAEQDETGYHLRAVNEAKGVLSQRERIIFDLVFEMGMPLEEIGQSLEEPITRERVRQIKEEALEKLREYLKNSGALEFLNAG